MKTPIISTREIAKIRKSRHSDVVRAVDNIVEKVGSNNKMYKETTYEHRGNQYRELILTLKGLKLYIDISRKTPSLSKVIDIYHQEIERRKGMTQKIVLVDRFENSFLNDLEDTLKAMGINLERQFTVKGYRIDAYIPELNIAIEYDEKQHKYCKEEDEKREQEIKGEIGCDFIRLSYKQTNAYNIGLVVNHLIYQAINPSPTQLVLMSTEVAIKKHKGERRNE